MIHEWRVDRARLSKATPTPTGGVRVQGAVSRVGVLEYRRADGSTVKELVPASALSSALQSLKDAVVCVGHPAGGSRLVSPSTYRQDAVGHISGEPRLDGDHVVADLAIQDADAIRRVDAGELRELSAGYRAEIEETPGVYQGQRYDQVQRRREYNHVALLPAGQGRAGSSVALRIDSAEMIDPAPAPEASAEPQSVDDRVAALEAAVVDLTARVAAIEGAEPDEQTTEPEGDVAPLLDSKSTLRFDDRVDARLDLVERARRVLGERYDHKGKSDLEIMREAILKAHPKFSIEGRSDDYIRARFDGVIDALPEPLSPSARARGEAFGAFRADAEPVRPPGVPSGRLEDKWREGAERKATK